jgi:MOSC domain-containing protein YiiM
LANGVGKISPRTHAGTYVQHRYLARRSPTQSNLRQVHLIQAELFQALAAEGFRVRPGELGENVTIQGFDLLTLPLHTRLQLGTHAVVALTGLRTPCGYIDKFQKGLKRQMILQGPGRPRFRAGVMSTVERSGTVKLGDRVEVRLPAKPWEVLPELP